MCKVFFMIIVYISFQFIMHSIIPLVNISSFKGFLCYVMGVVFSCVVLCCVLWCVAGNTLLF